MLVDLQRRTHTLWCQTIGVTTRSVVDAGHSWLSGRTSIPVLFRLGSHTPAHTACNGYVVAPAAVEVHQKLCHMVVSAGIGLEPRSRIDDSCIHSEKGRICYEHQQLLQMLGSMASAAFYQWIQYTSVFLRLLLVLNKDFVNLKPWIESICSSNSFSSAASGFDKLVFGFHLHCFLVDKKCRWCVIFLFDGCFNVANGSHGTAGLLLEADSNDFTRSSCSHASDSKSGFWRQHSVWHVYRHSVCRVCRSCNVADTACGSPVLLWSHQMGLDPAFVQQFLPLQLRARHHISNIRWPCHHFHRAGLQ